MSKGKRAITEFTGEYEEKRSAFIYCPQSIPLLSDQELIKKGINRIIYG